MKHNSQSSGTQAEQAPSWKSAKHFNFNISFTYRNPFFPVVKRKSRFFKIFPKTFPPNSNVKSEMRALLPFHPRYKNSTKNKHPLT